MRIGIPKALLFYRYHMLWETFFNNLDVDYIISPDTNQNIISRGMRNAVDEACLSFKVYLGHADWLLDKCDLLLVPRISSLGTCGTICTRFHALYDVLNNTFRDRNIKLLPLNMDLKNLHGEMGAFLEMGDLLGKNKYQCARAYLKAKKAEKTRQFMERKSQERLLNQKGIKILIISYHYNLLDGFIGGPVLDALEKIGVIPVPGTVVNRNEAIARSVEISETLPWAFSSSANVKVDHF